MKKLLIFVLLLCAAALPAQVVTVSNPSVHIPVSTDMGNGRYEHIQSTIVRNQSFLVDKYTGRMWLRVVDKNDFPSYQAVYVENLPEVDSTRINYQLYMGGMMAADCFLVNIYTGEAWVYVKAEGDYKYFQRLRRRDFVTTPEDIELLRTGKWTMLFEPNPDQAPILEECAKRYATIYSKAERYGMLNDFFLQCFFETYYYLYTTPTRKNVEDLEVISKYVVSRVELSNRKAEKRLQKANSLQEYVDIFLELAQ